MSVEAFAKWAGQSAITNCELGSQLAWRAILDLLERHGQHEAHEIVETFGPDAIHAAFAEESWRTEENESPAEGESSAPSTTTRTTP